MLSSNPPHVRLIYLCYQLKVQAETTVTVYRQFTDSSRRLFADPMSTTVHHQGNSARARTVGIRRWLILESAPGEPRWGTMGWRHALSAQLVTGDRVTPPRSTQSDAGWPTDRSTRGLLLDDSMGDQTVEGKNSCDWENDAIEKTSGQTFDCYNQFSVVQWTDKTTWIWWRQWQR